LIPATGAGVGLATPIAQMRAMQTGVDQVGIVHAGRRSPMSAGGSSLGLAGFVIEEVRDAPDRPSRELVFVARQI